MLPEAKSVPPIESMRRNRMRLLDEQWWDKKKGDDDLGASVFLRVEELREAQRMQLIDMATSVITYHGPQASRILGSLGLPGFVAPSAWMRRTPQVHNITAWGIDTVASLITSNKPKATFLTTGGSWDEQERAKKLTDFVEGVFIQNQVYALGNDIVLDALVLGDGIVKVFIDKDDRIRYGRVLRPNLLIDEDEAVERNPRQMYERHLASREQVVGLFPSKVKEIDDAPLTALDGALGLRRRSYTTRSIEVIEAWRLSEGKALRGRHVITLRNSVLLDEPWEEPDFPFVFFKWKKPRIGFWGISLAQELRPQQVALNMLNDYILETIRRVSRARIWVPESARVSISQLGNGIASAYRYSGLRPPTIDNSDAVPREMIEERNEKLSSWAPTAGVGPDAAAGSMPAGLRSGQAQRVHEQFQDRRLTVQMDSYAEDLFMGLARKTVRLVRAEVKRTDKSFLVKVKSDGSLVDVDFKDANLPDSDIDLQVSPTNFFADSPEDRIDQVVDLGQNQILNRVQMVAGLDYPDVRALTDPITAGYRNGRWIVGQLRLGRSVPVRPYMDLDQAVPLVVAALLDMLPQNPSPKLVDVFERWLHEANAEQQARAQAMAPPPPAPGAPGAGGPLPGGPIASGPVAPLGELSPFRKPKA